MSKLSLDQIVIVDVEATCWKKSPPLDQVSQIIEIGACLLNTKTLEITKNAYFFVKPTKSEVSAFCTELTSITPEMVAILGKSLKAACSWLVHEYGSYKRVWASYGDYDRNIFQRNCRDEDVHYPFSNRHLNIKTLFALKSSLSREVGMAKALEILNLSLTGTHHRAADDAYNIAKIAAWCLRSN